MYLILVRDTRLVNSCMRNYTLACNVTNIRNNIPEFKSFDDSHPHKYSAAQLQLPSNDSISFL